MAKSEISEISEISPHIASMLRHGGNGGHILIETLTEINK